jgi:hypothetical protein
MEVLTTPMLRVGELGHAVLMTLEPLHLGQSGSLQRMALISLN